MIYRCVSACRFKWKIKMDPDRSGFCKYETVECLT